MKNPEIYREIGALLQPMTDHYARRAKVAPHFDEALQGVMSGDPVVTDRGLRELYKTHQLGTLHREQVLYCLKLLNGHEPDGSTDRTVEAESESKQARSIRRRKKAAIQRRWGIAAGAISLGGVALLKQGDVWSDVRFLGLGTLLLLLFLNELRSWWREQT